MHLLGVRLSGGYFFAEVIVKLDVLFLNKVFEYFTDLDVFFLDLAKDNC